MRFDMIKVGGILESRVCPVKLPHPSAHTHKIKLDAYTCKTEFGAKSVDVGVPITDAANVAFEVTNIDRVKVDL